MLWLLAEMIADDDAPDRADEAAGAEPEAPKGSGSDKPKRPR